MNQKLLVSTVALTLLLFVGVYKMTDGNFYEMCPELTSDSHPTQMTSDHLY